MDEDEVEVGICIVCHCVYVVLGLGYAKVGFCVFVKLIFVKRVGQTDGMASIHAGN